MKIPSDFLSFERFLEVVKQLNFQASPGLPFCYRYPTNAQLFDWDGEYFSLFRARMVYEWMIDAIQCDAELPFRVFVKDEPITQEKYEQQRWRLIFACPVIWQILDHMLFDYSNDKELECMWSVPSKLGWNPFFGGDRLAKMYFENPLSLDKSMWDWTYPDWLVEMEKEFRHRMVTAPALWHALVDFRFSRSFSNCVFQFSNGLKLRQQFTGFMKSGLVNTLSSNSHGQYFIHLLVSMRMGLPLDIPFWTIGDDVLADYPDLDLEEFKKQHFELGVLLKECKRELKFAGFDLQSMEPCYYSKHVTNLLYAEDLVEVLDAYQYLYCYSPKLELFQDILSELAPERVLSRKYLKAWAFDK